MRRLRLRALSEAERTAIEKLAHSRTAPARQVERACIVWQASQDQMAPAIAAALRLTAHTVRDWIKRFNAEAGWPGGPAPRRPPADVHARAGRRGHRRRADRPQALGPAVRLLDAGPAGGVPERAQGDRDQAQPDRRDSCSEGLTLAAAGDLVRRAGRSRLRRKRGPSRPSTRPHLRAVSSSASTRWGRSRPRASPASSRWCDRAVAAEPGAPRRRSTMADAARATSSAPSGRPPARRSPRRTAGAATANWVDFLEQVEAWLPAEGERVYAIVDNLNAHRATDVLLFALAHPRWEFVFQPTYAAYLNLIEPWWKVLRSLALKGRRFETWEEVCRPSPRRRPTGTRIAIRSSGAAVVATRPRRQPASPLVPSSHDLADAPLSATAGATQTYYWLGRQAGGQHVAWRSGGTGCGPFSGTSVAATCRRRTRLSCCRSCSCDLRQAQQQLFGLAHRELERVVRGVVVVFDFLGVAGREVCVVV